MQRKKKLVLNTFFSFLYRVCTIVCGFILPRLILNNFGSNVNGLVNSISQFLGIISFLELGLGSVIQSSLYKPLAEKDNDGISGVVVSGQKFFSRIAVILLFYVGVLIVAYPFTVNNTFGFVYTATLIICISISYFAQYYFGLIFGLLLRADQKGYILYIIETSTLVLNTVACFLLISYGAGIHIVKLTTSLVFVLRPILLSYFIKRNYKINWKIKYENEPIKQKWNGVSQHVASVVLDGTDNIVLTLFSELKNVSIYSVYFIVVNGVKNLFISMTNGIQSLMGEMWAKKEIEELKKFFGWVEWVIHTGTVFVFGVTMIAIVPFVSIYTRDVTDANYIQPLFAVIIVLANGGHCLRLPYNLMILACGHYKETQRNYIIATLLNIILSVVLVSAFGLIGVAIGTLVAMIYQTVWMAYYNSKNLIHWPFSCFLKQVFCDAISLILIYFVSAMIQFRTISYIEFVFYAFKVAIIAFVIILLVNLIFYRSNLWNIARKIRERFRLIFHLGK